ncbi:MULTISPECIES: aminodeoxychorismate synthase component I [Gracilibacillus]|uniref:aminodeoxychorismate synthase component I n=1 Tax=Gracilibacillus TaxID=74385 RepID=UPI000826B26D|nr:MULTISPECIES: aminodeoxychorismate synthase component I [Gracilibacillus]
MSDILLQFDFEKQTYQFQHPAKIWKTYKIDEIEELIHQLEKAVDQGYYIAGYLAYEAAPAFDANYAVSPNASIPLLWFAAFDQPIVGDTADKETGYSLTDWNSATNYSTYREHINKIKEAIAAGNSYQVNYTTRLHADFTGNPYCLYQQLRDNQAASYCAFLDLEEFQILSASPELFFRVESGIITTKPMKGTRKRGNTSQEDELLKQELLQSEKDRAENRMIVDLLRNDVGRIAKVGSVKVNKLFDVETYPTVHQMTSTITATLATNRMFDWFKALFPCGSITGAPKIETMKLIEKLETEPRNIYCGAIGFITPERKAIFNVPIRTVLIDRQQATYGTGSGITWDSNIDEEYDELYQKTKVLQPYTNYALIETMRLDNGSYPLLPYHLARLKQSCTYFAYRFNREEIQDKLTQLAQQYPNGQYKVRLIHQHQTNLSITELPASDRQQLAVIAPYAINPDDRYLYHKTTNRGLYETVDREKPEKTFTSLLWNTKEQATEFTTGNLVVEKEGRYYTPPVTDGLLPGTLREKLIDQDLLIEKSIALQELADYEKIWFINGLRGWIEIELTDEQTKQSPSI